MDELSEGGKNLEILVTDSEILSDPTEIGQTESTTDREDESSGTEHCDGAKIGATGGSEETFDMLCQQCLEDEKHVEACMYCTECEEYLCELCVNMHRKVRLTKGHTLISKDASGEHNERVFETMKETCLVHIGENLDWFCSSHSSACCTVCRFINHEKCDGVVTLAAAMEEVSLDERVQNALEELKKTQSHLGATISQAHEFLKKLDEDRNESLMELESIKKEIDKAFERLYSLVRKDKQKIENKYNEIKGKVEFDVEKRSRFANTVAASIKILTNERLNDEYKFVQILKAESDLKTLEITAIATFDDFNFEKMHYERDVTLVSKLQAVHKLGHIDTEKPVYTISSPRKIKVLKDNQKKSDIIGICQIDKQSLVLADWGNSCLKILDTSEEVVKCSFKVDHSPFDICKIDDLEIAVTLLHGKKVALFSLSEYTFYGLQLEQSIDTSEKCRGIAFFNSNLYIACGGGGTENEGPGHIRVYNLDGKLITTILHDSVSMALLSKPWKIRFSPTTATAYVTDTSYILTVNPRTNHEIGIFASNVRQSKKSLCFDSAGRVLVSNYNSRSVDILSVDGKRKAPLLTSDSLPSKPIDLAFDTSNSRLYIGMEDCTFVLCFDLEEIKWKTAPRF